MKTAKHNGQTCYFREKDHAYFLGDKNLLSVTQFKEQFFPAFDTEKVATKYAKKHGLNVEEVLAEWDKKGQQGRERGDIIHVYAESQFLGTTVAVPDCYNGHRQAVDTAVTSLNKRFEHLASEAIVFSASLALAGQIDLLMRDKRNGDVLILDWKTDSAIKCENTWENALPLIDHLEACNYNEYAIQLGLYERILREEKYFPEGTVYRRALCHVQANGVPGWYRIPNMQEEIERMLSWI